MTLFQLLKEFIRRHWQHYCAAAAMLLAVAVMTVLIPRRVGAVIDGMVNLSPRGIREHLKLNRPIYVPTSAYGHFGRVPDVAKGTFTWEMTDLADELKRAFGR